MTEDEKLDFAFAALAHPARRAMLARLAQGEATVKELAEPFDVSMPAISKHLRVLEGAGLIERSRNAQFRPCRLNTDPLKSIANWTDQYRHIWEVRFEAMEKLLSEMKDLKDG
ncbi:MULTISPECIES: helix-turn-helix transcriptional regulator [unclassified Ruegeria]|uniref:ArsR/SmtB family transcription factor n=1 Tax=unclassified Ruegeria TaxID=2625375 RepID=UPI0014898CDE|nr:MULTISPECIES: metalloregulator ArsR/SmtB family transcription factor [unclassified Ruegeria]